MEMKQIESRIKELSFDNLLKALEQEAETKETSKSFGEVLEHSEVIAMIKKEIISRYDNK